MASPEAVDLLTNRKLLVIAIEVSPRWFIFRLQIVVNGVGLVGLLARLVGPIFHYPFPHIAVRVTETTLAK